VVPIRACVDKIRISEWDVVRLEAHPLQVDVVPGKGGDILSVRWLPSDIDLLWTSPWGLRRKGATSMATDSVSRFLESYPGGWQSIFPNGGDACVDDGVEHGFHGEACLASWQVERVFAEPEQAGVVMSALLERSNFFMTKQITVEQGSVVIVESARNLSAHSREVMWSHHPAFGPPFLSEDCIVGADARRFVVDDERDTPAGDLPPGSISKWPHAAAKTGGIVDLGSIPAGPSDRFGYLTDFEAPRMWIRNPSLGLVAEITWDLSVFPYAWFWLEKNATVGYPWFGDAFVLGLEPASSYPGQGIVNVRRKTTNLLRFAEGETKTAEVRLTVSQL